MLLRIFFTLLILAQNASVLLPIKVSDRKDISAIKLTNIGRFGIPRKARPTVAAHLHTGIDIKRPNNDYETEPIFPVAKGKVISKRTDGPYAQLIIEHEGNGKKFWTLYEHIAGIIVNLHEAVSTNKPIARFMNKKELNTYGWQFDHFHLEILKLQPMLIKPDKALPERHYSAPTLTCFKAADLEKWYYPPLRFLSGKTQ